MKNLVTAEAMFELAEVKSANEVFDSIDTAKDELENKIKQAAADGSFELFYAINSDKFPFLSYSKANTSFFVHQVQTWLKKNYFICKNLLRRNSKGKWIYYGLWICWDRTILKHTNEYNLPKDFKITNKDVINYWKRSRNSKDLNGNSKCSFASE